jgi:hypothetical protein
MPVHDPGDGDDRGPGLIAAAVLLFTLAATTVALRFYTRLRIVRVFGPEDWTILVALVLSLGVSTGSITSMFARVQIFQPDGI